MGKPLPQAAVDLLTREVYAHIVTLNRDGSPHVTLVWVEARDGAVSFNTARGRKKTRNLERDPRIVVSVQDAGNPRQYAVFSGTARLIDEGAIEQIDGLAKKYLGRDVYPAHRPDEPRVRVDVDLERITGMGPWVA
ncbi:MAG: PPOX class F420-dependent oxidoreductase [Chloroflexi bacterium]|nr:PPOX class F420-dependent oxidoreductase [Chloroflexota bacterium]MDA1240626.1 PPOX class F420-dependent oxidoreductase [Chloroflexota bacterium]